MSFSLEGGRSIQLSYGRVLKNAGFIAFCSAVVRLVWLNHTRDHSLPDGDR
jgi:hypothetical protein